MSDSIMLPPGTLPGQASHVPALEARTAPLDDVQVEMKYYYYALPSATMFRNDGKRIVFIEGVAATDWKKDQEYLDNCIASGSVPHLAYALPEQIMNFKLHTNPRAAYSEMVRGEVVEEVTGKIEARLREELVTDPEVVAAAQAAARAEVLKELEAKGGEIPEELKKWLISEPTRPVVEGEQGGSARDIAGVDAASALNRLKTGEQTITVTNPTALAALKGIQSTADNSNKS